MMDAFDDRPADERHGHGGEDGEPDGQAVVGQDYQAMKVENIAISPWAKLRSPVDR